MKEGEPIIKPEYKIHEPDKRIELVSSLSEALESEDKDTVQKILQDKKLLRSLIIDRGKGNKNLDLLEDSFNALLREKFGPDKDMMDVDGEALIKMLKELNLPEQILAELVDIAYHKKDKVKFYRLLNIIFGNEDAIEDKSVVNNARHDHAAWKAAREQDFESAIKINKLVMDETEEQGDKILKQKAKFGVTAAKKNLKPKYKAKDFEEIRKEMKKEEHFYDAHRASIEEAKARLDMVKGQKGKQSDLRFDNLDIAKKITKEAFAYAKENSYRNLEILVLETLSKIYKEQGEKHQAGIYRKKAEKAGKRYRYSINA